MKEDMKAMLPIIQGYAEGKTVECRRKDMGFAPWDEVDIVLDGFFDLHHYEYRIKPEEGATQEYVIDKELKDELILRLKEIEIACNNCTSAQIQIIKNRATMCASFIQNHCKTKER